MSFYKFDDVSWAQCQASGFWLHFRNSIMGWVRLDYRQRRRPLRLGVSISTPGHVIRVAVGRHSLGVAKKPAA